MKKITKTYSSSFEMAYKYFSIISLLNSIKLRNRELELLAFTLIKGTISTGGAKYEFITQHGSSMGTIGNMIDRLSKLNFIIKRDKRYIINPILQIDVSKPFELSVKIDAKR